MQLRTTRQGLLLLWGAAASLCMAQPGIRPLSGNAATVDQSGSYIVASSLAVNAATNAALVITASSVTVDLNGQELQCPGNLSGVGLRVAGAQNVVVRNGHISKCFMGVVVMNSANVRLENLTIRGMGLAVSAPPPEIDIMIVQSRNVVAARNSIYNTGLGIFVRGSRSFGNRIEDNTITSMMNGALEICYNPADGDPLGRKGDLIRGNIIRGYPTAIQIAKGADYNLIQGNTLFFTKSALESENATNRDVDNAKIELK